MGILTWKNSEEHGFDVVDDSWLENVSATTWQYLDEMSKNERK
ncbi:MAG: hypothetical protein AB2809_04785 [Candidatus Thiodiazotropha sp.]